MYFSWILHSFVDQERHKLYCVEMGTSQVSNELHCTYCSLFLNFFLFEFDSSMPTSLKVRIKYGYPLQNLHVDITNVRMSERLVKFNT